MTMPTCWEISIVSGVAFNRGPTVPSRPLGHGLVASLGVGHVTMSSLSAGASHARRSISSGW